MNISDEAVEAALLAERPDRIQGFSYETRHVIRDIWLPPGEQELWSCGKDEPDAAVRFYHQCQVERLRVVLQAAAQFLIEEAAKVAADYGDWAAPMRNPGQFAAALVAAGEIATAIRALATPPSSPEDRTEIAV